MFQIAFIHALKNTSFGRALLGTMRVSGYLAAVGVVGSAIMVHQAKASIGENSLVLGRDLLPMQDLLKGGHTLNMNGQRIHIATTTTTQSVGQVLDRYEAMCKSGSEDAVVWNTIPDMTQGRLPTEILSTLPIVRRQDPNGNRGSLSCFAKGEAAKRSVSESLNDFFKTGDFGKLGKLRFVTAGAATNGGTGVITAWTDDSFNINALAPAEGTDAPGQDPADMPRPAKANRILSGGLEGMPYGIYMYVTDVTPSASIADYDVQMSGQKWTVVKSYHYEQTAHEGKEVRGYLNPTTGVQVYVTCDKLDDGRTGIGIAETRDFQDPSKGPDPVVARRNE